MAQFDVYRNPKGGNYPYLLDVQADLLERLSSRIVVPLINRKRLAAALISRLNPVVAIEGEEYVLMFQQLASIPLSALGATVTSIAKRRSELISSIDLLFTGV